MKFLKAFLFLFIALFFDQSIQAKQVKQIKKISKPVKLTKKKSKTSTKVQAKASPKVTKKISKKVPVKSSVKKNVVRPAVEPTEVPVQQSAATSEDLSTVPECSKHPKIIRVLIDEQKISKPVEYVIKSTDGFVLEGPSGSKMAAAFDSKTIELMVKDAKLYLKCKDQKFRHVKKDDLEVYPAKGHLTVNGKSYQGSLNFRINPFSASVLIINKLDLEDYVYSVLRSESVPSWSLESHKVQSIATRTYALYHMKQARQKNPYSLYDLRNSNLNQIYEGVHKFKCFRDAVDQTKGLVLTYHGNIALTMFDICCGGIIPANMRKNKKSPPYLRRTEPCTFCSNTSFYRNYLIYKKQDFVELLKSNPNLKHKFEGFGNKLVDIQIIDKDAAGVVHKVRLAGRTYVTLTCNELLSIFKNKIKSTAFTIKNQDNKITLVCKGWSHFNGLCQWGAKTLVDRGWDYKRVLNFYYPGTILSRLKA